MNKRKVLLIQTDTFILPIFDKFGAFLTGRYVDNKTEVGWLTNHKNDFDQEMADFWEEEDIIMQGITEVYISPHISTPFIPIPSNKYFSDGYGNVQSFASLDKNKKAITNFRNKTIADIYSKRIKILHTINKGKTFIKALKRKKQKLFETKLQPRNFYSDFGIVLSDEPDAECLDIIKTRAESYAKENKFKIEGIKVVALNYDWIKTLSDLI